MKALGAILFSVLLLWTQSARATPCEGLDRAPECNACACAQPGCCVSETPQNQPPTPAAPASSSATFKSQWLAMMAAVWVRPTPDQSPLLSTGQFSVPSVNAVPLHLRHCVFLV